MRNISAAECLPFAKAWRKAVLSGGLHRALIDFGERNDTPVGRSVKAIADHLMDGRDFSYSFRHASPRLPQAIETLLWTAIGSGLLDVALDGIVGLLEKHSKRKEISKKLASLLESCRVSPSSRFICAYCF
jgi:hypothetical protein